MDLDEDESSLRLRPDFEADPMSMEGTFADEPFDILKELEDDRKREIEDDKRMDEYFKRG